MRLAVIIPCYNHARYIGKALESALNQTRKPDRILVIDDGSKDDSPTVIRGFEARGVEFTARENRGAHNTINELVRRAAEDCDVISILNSDDHYAPDRFEKCLPLLEANPDKQVVCSALRVIGGDNAPLNPAEPRAKWFRAVWSEAERVLTDSADDAEREARLCEWMATANFPATTSNVIARAGWLLRFPFRPYRFNHDYYFLAQTALRGAMALHPEPLVNYRVHGANTMNVSPAPLLREMLRMHLDLYHDLAPDLRADPVLRARFARYARALWGSVSSFHAGLFQTLLAELAAKHTPEELEAAVAALEETEFPELSTYPNKARVNLWDESGPLSAETALAEKYEALRQSHRELKEREKAAKTRLRALENHFWTRLGRRLKLLKSSR